MPRPARSFEELASRYEPVIGLEVHAQLLTRTKLFCGCANRFGAPPNTLVCPVVPRPARGAARPQPPGGDARPARGAGDGLHRAARLGLRAQELLLSRPAQGLPDLAVREAARHRGLRGDRDGRRRREAGAPRAHPHGGGRGEAPARGLRVVGREERGGPQPRGRSPHRDRERARPALSRGGARLPDRAAGRCSSTPGSPTATWRRARCAATPTCPCARGERRPSARARRSRTSTPSATSPGPSSTRSRDRSRSSSPAARSSRRRGSGTPTGARRPRCAPRRRRTTTATSRSPTCRRSSSSPEWVERGPGVAARAARRRSAAASRPSTACRTTTRACSPRSRTWPTTSRPSRGRAATPRPPRTG